MSQITDTVFDCPQCDGKQSVQFNRKDGDSNEFKCGKCGELFTLDEDDVDPAQPVDEDSPPLPTAPPPPPPLPIPVESAIPPQVVDKNAQPNAELRPVTEDDIQKSRLTEQLNAITNNVDDLAPYLKKSRAWKWAQEQKKTGNPYRGGSRNAKIFDMFAEQPRSVVECVLRCEALGLADGIQFLLTIYTVLTECISAGLLIYDSASKKIRIATSEPVATGLP